MPFDPAQYGLDIDNREVAALTYFALVVVALVLWKAARKPALAVVRAFFAPSWLRFGSQ
jgi:hypothetical protein